MRAVFVFRLVGWRGAHAVRIRELWLGLLLIKLLGRLSCHDGDCAYVILGTNGIAGEARVQISELAAHGRRSTGWERKQKNPGGGDEDVMQVAVLAVLRSFGT